MSGDLLWLAPSFFLVALLYSVAGFGGGSSYLALLTFSSLPHPFFAPISLVCNVIAASSGLYHFSRAGHLAFRRVLPFLVTSVPCAYLGGMISIEKRPFFLIVGVALLLVGLRLFHWGPRPVRLRRTSDGPQAPAPRTGKARCSASFINFWLVGLSAGAILGLFSGLIGIGGGIFLAPLLLILGWAHSKEAAAAASLFIVFNSVSGLLGHLTKGGVEWKLFLPLGLSVFIGGQIGARLGSRSLSRMAVQRVTAVLILLVSGRIFWRLAAGGL